MDFKSYDPKFNKPSSLYDNKVVEPPIKSYGSFTNSPRPLPKKKSNKLLYIIVSFLILIGIGGAFILLTKHHNISKPIIYKKIQPSTTIIKTSNYNSSTSNLDFNYPIGWKVNDNNSGLIKVTSPIVNLTSDNLNTVKGQIIISINQQAVLPPSFGSYSVAVDNSQQISYNSPTNIQRNQTYLTFVQYPSTTVVGGLDGIYVTGAFGYQKLQVIPSTDITKLSPLIIVSFVLCANTSCSNSKPLTISHTMLKDNLINQTVYNIIKSLQIN